jgi:tetratricopeptide (TPR) repeat protein
MAENTVFGPNHPSSEDFASFLEGQLKGRAARRVLLHWAGGCPDCKGAAARLTAVMLGPGAPAGPPPDEDEYDAAISRALVGARLQVAARDKLELRVQEGVRAFHGGFGRYWSLGLPTRVRVEVELRLSWQQRYSSPERMLGHAQAAAVDVDLYLQPEDCGGVRPLEDIRARVHAECANAWRVNDNFAAALEQMKRAFAHWEGGTRDELILAHIHHLHATVLAVLSHYAAAQQALDVALRIYRRHRIRHLAGRVLISKGSYYGEAQEHAKALTLIRRGLRLIDPAEDPTLELAARFNLVSYSVELSQLDTAHRELWGLAARFEKAGQTMNSLRARWLQGKIHFRRGEHERAEREYTAARTGFLAKGHPYDTAMLSFELAVLLRETGRQAQARDLLLEALSVFRSFDLRDYTLAALHLFQQSFEDAASSADQLLGMIGKLEDAVRRSKALAAQAQVRGEDLR